MLKSSRINNLNNEQNKRKPKGNKKTMDNQETQAASGTQDTPQR